MKYQRDSQRSAPVRSQPLPDFGPMGMRAPTSGPPITGNRMALSGLINQTLRAVAERDQERPHILNTLIIAQILLTIVIAPGYLFPFTFSPTFFVLVATLLIYISALILNHSLRNFARAVYVLIFGGAAGMALQLFLTATLAHSPTATGQISLLFLTAIIEAGLLLTPDATLLLAAVTAMLTAVALLLALALAPDAGHNLSDVYLLMVYALGLQGLTGYLAWTLSQYLFYRVTNTQREQGAQFAQVRLDAQRMQMEEQRARVNDGVAAIQTAIARALSEDYDTRVDVPMGEMYPLSESLSLLIERMKAMRETERKLQRVEAMAVPLVEVAGRMTDTMTPTPSSLPIMTETALDSVPVAIGQAQAANARRLGRVQKLASEIFIALGHSGGVLGNTAEEVVRAQHIAGALIALTESLTSATQKQLDLLMRARRTLSILLPAEITQAAPDDAPDTQRNAATLSPEEAARLLGLGVDVGLTPGYTGKFDILSPASPEEAGIAPLAALPSLMNDAGGELPGELADVWHILSQLTEETTLEERVVSTLARELGILSRSVRQADRGVAWLLQAFDAMRHDADQLQQVSGGAQPLPMESAQSAIGAQELRMPPPSTPLNTYTSGSLDTPTGSPYPSRPLDDMAAPPPYDPTPAPGSLSGSLANSDATLAELAAEAPRPFDAPGSIRVNDLLGLDVLPPDSPSMALDADAMQEHIQQEQQSGDDTTTP
ncbi:MAG: hypothetical protein ABI068_11610 [Ktedonobacterales bacterium]